MSKTKFTQDEKTAMACIFYPAMFAITLTLSISIGFFAGAGFGFLAFGFLTFLFLLKIVRAFKKMKREENGAD